MIVKIVEIVIKCGYIYIFIVFAYMLELAAKYDSKLIWFDILHSTTFLKLYLSEALTRHLKLYGKYSFTKLFNFVFLYGVT